jgi:hypothetical protein
MEKCSHTYNQDLFEAAFLILSHLLQQIHFEDTLTHNQELFVTALSLLQSKTDTNLGDTAPYSDTPSHLTCTYSHTQSKIVCSISQPPVQSKTDTNLGDTAHKHSHTVTPISQPPTHSRADRATDVPGDTHVPGDTDLPGDTDVPGDTGRLSTGDSQSETCNNRYRHTHINIF